MAAAPRRKLPAWMSEPLVEHEEEENEDTKALADAEFAVEILQAEEDAREALEDWGLYDYLGQEEEEEEDFNLSDSEVANSISSDEALAAIRKTRGAEYDTLPLKTNRALLLWELRASIAAIVAKMNSS